MTFTASNGVELDHEGIVEAGLHSLNQIHKARAEFYQHLRDEELGRWRWPENPDYVVYAQGDGWIVASERSANSKHYSNREHTQVGTSILTQAMRAYFEAHPESKPWHDAKPGEVWVLSVDGSDDIPCIVTPSGPDFEPISHPVWATFSRGSDRITDARKIWPEPS